MEHFALIQPVPMVAVPEGMRLVLVRVEDSGGAWSASSSLLPVVGIQPTTVYHYTRPEPAPVHQSPSMMESHGWEFRHAETRYAPVFLTAEGRLSHADPDDPGWRLIPPGTSDEQAETVAESLRAIELQRLELEKRIENTEERASEVEED